ncbi:MAG: MBOAT family O-acyltransferase [Helicobacter sp.]|nr:MBOAT family O-acyltransferase [Helicobacter sp.]
MNFFSIEFGILFLIFLAIYWRVERLWCKNLLIFGFNYLLIFGLGDIYVGVMLFLYSAFIYFASKLIWSLDSEDRERYIRIKRKRDVTLYAFICAILLAILNLSFFKYSSSIFDFFTQILRFVGLGMIDPDIVMPLGISFYTFASITYLRWVYENRLNPYFAPQKFGALCAYLSFFPTFVAGPIFRAKDFFAQYHRNKYWDRSKTDIIFVLLLFGIVKKVLIANYAGIYAAMILKDPDAYSASALLSGIYFYGIQIYADFSGYVNLVGAFGLLIGFNLPPNFNAPYMARNLRDFWHRWHISLSNFIKDYVYIPLGGNRRGFVNTQIFIMIGFILSGIWHGNTSNFFIWGAIHGLGIVGLNILKMLRISFAKIPLFSKLFTFHFVSFAWIFFHYETFGEARSYLLALFSNHLGNLWILVYFLIAFVIYQFCENLLVNCIRIFSKIPALLKSSVFAIVLFFTFEFMPEGIPNFIYANF